MCVASMRVASMRCVHGYMCLCVHTCVRVGGDCVCLCNVYAYLGMCSLWSLPHTNPIMFKEGSLIWSH